MNLARLLVSPQGFRPFVANWEEIAGSVLGRIEEELARSSRRDALDEALLEELLPVLRALRRRQRTGEPGAVLLPVKLRRDEMALDLFTTITTLGTPLDRGARPPSRNGRPASVDRSADRSRITRAASPPRQSPCARISGCVRTVSSRKSKSEAKMGPPNPHHPHGHSDHDHDHDEHPGPHGSPLTDTQLRVRALESLLVDKGLVDPAALDVLIDTYETKVGPRNGAQVVARAWVDPGFKKRLLADASSAIAELGYMGRQGEDMIALENTPKVHNLVVCTLCSCYPWPVLGLPPVWYKSGPYRSRAVIDPRGVLREFGVELAGEVEVRVFDSTAEVRYLVIPERPAGTEGMSESQLAELVTRDSMIGVANAKGPGR